MTTRLNTVEYACATNFSTLAASTTYSFASITITLPETTSRVFESVFLEITAQANITAATTSTTAPVASIQLGAATTSNINIPVDASNGANYHALWGGHFLVDVTSYFTANFGGSSTQTAVVGFKLPIASQNLSARIVITYQFTDADNTRAKTVRIPIDGGAGALTTSLASIGSTDIPNLSTFCPEGSATFTNVHFEVTYTAREPSAATFVTTWALDSETGQAESAHQIGGETVGAYTKYVLYWLRNDMTTNATHDFKAKSSVAASAYNVCVVLVATYTYSESGTTTVLNSLMIPFTDSSMGVNANTTAKRATWQATVYVEEPATVTLVQSGARLATVQLQTGTAYDAQMMRLGSQTYRSYTHPGLTTFGGNPYGEVHMQIRGDSAASEGAGFTLARGLNTITLDSYFNGSAEDSVNPMAAVLYLNYTSGVASGGTATHNKTIRTLMLGSTVGSPIDFAHYDFGVLTPIGPPEATWWQNGFAACFTYTNVSGAWLADVLAGEQAGTGHLLVGQAVNGNIAENVDSIRHVMTGPARLWDRSAGEVDTVRLAPFSGRRWTLMGGFALNGTMIAAESLYTYSSISYSASGTATGYTGAGSGITVNIHRSDTGELVATTTTASGGAFSATLYDNTIGYYAEARQDGTHLGRSDLAEPS